MTNATWFGAAAYAPPAAHYDVASWFVADPLIIIADGGPLRQPSVLGEVTNRAYVSDPGPLRQPSVLGGIGVFGRIAVDTMLGAPEVLAQHKEVRAIITAPSVLAGASVVGTHFYDSFVSDSINDFVCHLETPAGAVRVPISSWQATLRTDEAQYAQVVIPACADWAETLAIATEFVVVRRAILEFPIEQEMVRCPVEQVNTYRGSLNYTATLSGYTDASFVADANPSTIYDRTMLGVQTVSVANGLRRARCSIDWLLRPGQRAYVDGEELLVDWINYYVGDGGVYMDIGESV